MATAMVATKPAAPPMAKPKSTETTTVKALCHQCGFEKSATLEIPFRAKEKLRNQMVDEAKAGLARKHLKSGCNNQTCFSIS